MKTPARLCDGVRVTRGGIGKDDSYIEDMAVPISMAPRVLSKAGNVVCSCLGETVPGLVDIVHVRGR